MVTRRRLLQALDIVTEGGAARRKPRGVGRDALEDACAAARPWSMDSSVQGMGIAEKVSDGVPVGETVFKVYIDRKRPRNRCENPVPRRLDLPGIGESIATDVHEIGKVELELFTTRSRPAVPGSSIAHSRVAAGTLGCLVRKRGRSEPLYILSNSHVIAYDGVGRAGDPILQPAGSDGGQAPEDVLAELTESFPFEFTTEGYPNLVDAAIAEVPADKVEAAIRLIGIPEGTSTYLRRGMMVQKTGRTTDRTVGEIIDVNHCMALRYWKSRSRKHRVGFRDQVLCTRYTGSGDSGSAVLNMSGKMVGLHFAGSASSSIFNRIEHVLELLDLEIVTAEHEATAMDAPPETTVSSSDGHAAADEGDVP